MPSTTYELPTRSRLRWIISALILSMLMSSLGQMIFSAALPTIVGELGGVEHMSWVITGFLIGQTVSLPVFGKLGDQIGRKGLFLFANGLFVLGSAMGGAAQSMGVLIFARVLQGIAGGGMMILSQAITAEVTTARERGKYMGIMGSVFGVASVIGPVLGGWFTDGPGWRWGLWLNIPLGGIAIVAIAILLRLPRRPRDMRFDYLGAVTMVVASSSLILVATWGGNEYPWTSPVIVSLLAVAIIAGVIFLVTELKTAEPLIPVRYLRYRNFLATTIAGFGIGLAMLGTLSYLPTYFQMVHAMSPTQAGLTMVFQVAGLMLTSIGVGNLISRTGRYKWFPVVGLAILAIALVLMSFWDQRSPLWVLASVTFLFGFGIGMAMQVIVLIVQNSFPVAEVGTVTGANNFFRQIGGSIGSAVVGGLFIANLTEIFAERGTPPGLDGDVSNLTPALVDGLSEGAKLAVENAYNDALTPIFLLLAPIAALCSALLVLIREDHLKETIE